jgi:hypothetical protein
MQQHELPAMSLAHHNAFSAMQRLGLAFHPSNQWVDDMLKDHNGQLGAAIEDHTLIIYNTNGNRSHYQWCNNTQELTCVGVHII